MISSLRVVEDFESRAHKAVTLLAERDKEIQEVRELKLSRALPGYSGVKIEARQKEGKRKGGGR